MSKKILFLFAVFFFALCLVYVDLYLKNNRKLEFIDKLAVSESLEQSVQWLVNNEEKILDNNNPMLWWMLKRSAEITKDYRIIKLYRAYKTRYIDSNLANIWRPLFIPYTSINLNRYDLSNFPDYNLYFLYGLTCNKDYAKREIIQKQMRSDFCPTEHPISPACVTHQLMGLQFRIMRQCGDRGEMLSQSKELQDMISLQLHWDVRVVDVYLQRVLMLIDTGASERVKNQWVQNILNQQSADGGWGPYQSLIEIGGDKAVVFYGKGIKIVRPETDLHATAQGVLIMSLLASMQGEVVDMADSKGRSEHF